MTAKWGGEFVVFADCDLIFHLGWLDNIIELWRENSEYFCLAPYTWTAIGQQGLCYRSTDLTARREIVLCDHPSSWCFVRRRDDDFVPDTRFKDWNAEFDFYEWMKLHDHKAGVCYNARVDHTGWGPRVLGTFGFDMNDNIKDGDRMFNEKWRMEHLEGNWLEFSPQKKHFFAKLMRKELAGPDDLNGAFAFVEGIKYQIISVVLPNHRPRWVRGEPVTYYLKGPIK